MQKIFKKNGMLLPWTFVFVARNLWNLYPRWNHSNAFCVLWGSWDKYNFFHDNVNLSKNNFRQIVWMDLTCVLQACFCPRCCSVCFCPFCCSICFLSVFLQPGKCETTRTKLWIKPSSCGRPHYMPQQYQAQPESGDDQLTIIFGPGIIMGYQGMSGISGKIRSIFGVDSHQRICIALLPWLLCQMNYNNQVSRVEQRQK